MILLLSFKLCVVSAWGVGDVSRIMGISKIAAAALVAAMLGSVSAIAAEVTLRMKGGDFSVTGDLQSFDNSKYTILSKSLGTMSLDAARFDCEGAGCPKGNATIGALAKPTAANVGPTRIAIAGSNTVGGALMPALIQAYAQSVGVKATKVLGADPLDMQLKLTDAKGGDAGVIDLQRRGSTTAFAGLEKKSVDLGMSSRQVKAEEVAKLSALGLGDMRLPSHEHVLGLDGLQVIVAPGNPAVSLPIDTIAKIFAGVVKDWSEVGLPAGKINVYAPTADSGTFETFDTLVLKPRNLKFVEGAKRTENHAEQADLVTVDPAGIGFTSIAFQRNTKALNVENSCGLIARPSVFAMKTEEYPLTRRLFLYTAGEPQNPLARNILAFALSPAAQPVVRQTDFIDQSPELLDFQAQTTRIAYALNAAGPDFDLNLMKTLISELKPASRLSTTFRFETANFSLDTKATTDVGRLRALLESKEYAGKTVILAGFADGIGRFDNNLILAQKRAAAVQRALQTAGNKPIVANVVTKAYSQLAPVACNDTNEGRAFNRRVEVWVK
jgi:phosphate transport system substrate-binding protein